MGPKSSPFWIASPYEEAKKRRSQQCIEEASSTGLKSAAIACVVSTLSTLAAVRMVPWAKANINHTGQALIISAASIATYVITTDKAMLECARKNTHYDRPA